MEHYNSNRLTGFVSLAVGALVFFIGWNIEWSGWFLWSLLTAIFLASPLLVLGAWHVVGSLGHRNWKVKVKVVDDGFMVAQFLHFFAALALVIINFAES